MSVGRGGPLGGFLGVRLAGAELARVRARAAQDGVGYSDVVRRALALYLEDASEDRPVTTVRLNPGWVSTATEVGIASGTVILLGGAP